MRRFFTLLAFCALFALPARAVNWTYCDGALAGTAIPNNVLGGLASSSDTSQTNETVDACASWPAGTSSAAAIIFIGRTASIFYDPAIATAGGCAGTCQSITILRCQSATASTLSCGDILGVPVFGDDGVADSGPCAPPTSTNCHGPANATVTGVPAGWYYMTISGAPTSTDTAKVRITLQDALWPPRP